ncbi:uncharacterized protein LOC134824992 [Bolinopsis microptera]|uniref:uncharacterized protein LOC134824992 n=1 Tax=Bolinopsis microptera TaxID=2820187 RepID=UPI00307B0E41
MKVFLILMGVFSVVSAAVKKCNGVDGVTPEDCATEDVACTSPKFAEYGGLSTQAYGCGECPANSATTCAQCVATADTGCNTKVALTGKLTFLCYKYEYTASKWKKVAAPVTCHANSGTAVKCNSPGKSADSTYTVPHNGCGPCDATAKTANKCSDCTTAKCNSASTLAFVLAPLLAVIFHAF